MVGMLRALCTFTWNYITAEHLESDSTLAAINHSAQPTQIEYNPLDVPQTHVCDGFKWRNYRSINTAEPAPLLQAAITYIIEPEEACTVKQQYRNILKIWGLCRYEAALNDSVGTLNELCTRVSSRSMTTHIFPWSWASTSGKRLGSYCWGDTQRLVLMTHTHARISFVLSVLCL